MSREIHLTGKLGRGKVFIVDDEDYLRCRKHYWWLMHEYVVTTINHKLVSVQNFIMEVETNYMLMVDHKDRDPFNNQRDNLRVCSSTQNNSNHKLRKDSTTGYTGVYKRGKKYDAYITHNKQYHYLGNFDTAEDAARAYDKNSIIYHGEFGRTNFPRSDYEEL